MAISTNQLNSEIIYPDSDGALMAESDPARDYLVYINVLYNSRV